MNKNNIPLRTKGKGLKKEAWFSICSCHQEYEESCKLCNTGNWENICKYKLSGLFYELFPNLWIWWVNLGNKRQKWLNHFKNFKDK